MSFLIYRKSWSIFTELWKYVKTKTQRKVNEWKDCGNLIPGKTKNVCKEGNENRIPGSAMNIYTAIKDWIWIRPEL